MANLPPRPKSPLPMLSTRDRVASAQPMASWPRDDRHPPNRSSRDTYIPSYREGRRDDRDRERYRDYDRRDRYRRDWSPPPRRRDSPDRDRRPSHRGPPRRYQSPRRGSYYPTSRSRSPPPRRRSPSPRRHRSPTRSRSRSPRRSPKPLRFGQAPVAISPRSLKREHSRSRSRTPPTTPAQRSGVQETDSKADILDTSIPPLKTKESPTRLQPSEPQTIKGEEPDILLHSHTSEIHRTRNIASPHLEDPPTDPVKVESPKVKLEEWDASQHLQNEVKSEPTQTDIRTPGIFGAAKINVDSPTLPAWTPKSPPRTSFIDEKSSRPSGPGLHRPRSPPTGPRAYGNHSRSGNPHSHPSASGTTQYLRGSKRKQGPFVPNQKNRIHLPDGEFVDVYPKVSDQILADMEKTVEALQRSAHRRTMEILEESKHLSRKLHEFKMASMDLRGAENRRKMSEVHLEKARNGSLGIGYSDEPTESKT